MIDPAGEVLAEINPLPHILTDMLLPNRTLDVCFTGNPAEQRSRINAALNTFNQLVEDGDYVQADRMFSQEILPLLNQSLRDVCTPQQGEFTFATFNKEDFLFAANTMEQHLNILADQQPQEPPSEPVPVPADIPTLTPYGIIIFTGLLLAVLMVIRRKNQ